jgi:hypothetical protein
MAAPGGGSTAGRIGSEGGGRVASEGAQGRIGQRGGRGGGFLLGAAGLAALALGLVAVDQRSRSQAPRGGDAATVSYDARGRILHRFLAPPPGDGTAPGGEGPAAAPGAAPEARGTPTFVYDPRRGKGDAAPPAGPARDAPAAEPVAPPLSADRPVPRRERAGSDTPPAPADPNPGPMSEGGGLQPPAADGGAREVPPGAAAGAAESEAEPANGAPEAAPPDAEPAPREPPASNPDEGPAPGAPPTPGGPEGGPDATRPLPQPAPEETTLPQPDRIRPDRATEQETNLEYFETFNPSIVPHKRGRALDAVDASLELHLAAAPLVPITPGEVIAVASARREVFSAEAVVEARGDEAIPLPSVSAADAILSWEVEPQQPVTFLKDGASNLYVRLSRPGRARLRWRVAAPLTWFSRTSDAARRLPLSALPDAVRPRPPATVRQQALEVARAIGVPRGATLGRTLDALVLYFRGFAPGEPPPERAGVYRDLALGKVGVCRHRAYAFVTTALGLGVPARYVYNEAHVFVEVWLPADEAGPAGWTRIDLGGGADTLDVHGARDKTLHRPPPDAFPVPDGFDTDAIAGATEVRGLPPTRTEPRDEVAEPGATPSPGEATTGAAATPGGPAAGVPEGGETGAGGEPVAGEGPAREGPARTGSGGSDALAAIVEAWRWPASALERGGRDGRGGGRGAEDAPADPRVRTAVRIDEIGRMGVVTRGVPFDVRGQVVAADDAAPVPGFVQVLLVGGDAAPGASTGAHGAPRNPAPWALGGAALDAAGGFKARVVIPVEMPPGSYELVVEYPGSMTHGPSIGR